MRQILDLILIIIIVPILYLILGTIFGIILTFWRSNNLKLKIILLFVLRPLVFTLLLSLLLPILFENSRIILGCFALAVILRDLVLGQHKFLVCVTSNSDKLSIRYLDKFLRIKNFDVSVDDAIRVRVSNINSISEYPGSLKLNNSASEFLILCKKTWSIASARLEAANIRLEHKPSFLK